MRIALVASALAFANAAEKQLSVDSPPGTGYGGLLRAENFRAPSTLASTPMMTAPEMEIPENWLRGTEEEQSSKSQEASSSSSGGTSTATPVVKETTDGNNGIPESWWRGAPNAPLNGPNRPNSPNGLNRPNGPKSPHKGPNDTRKGLNSRESPMGPGPKAKLPEDDDNLLFGGKIPEPEDFKWFDESELPPVPMDGPATGWASGPAMMADPGFGVRTAEDNKQSRSTVGTSGQGGMMMRSGGLRAGGLLQSMFSLIDDMHARHQERMGAMSLDMDARTAAQQAFPAASKGPRGPQQDFGVQTSMLPPPPRREDTLVEDTTSSSFEELWMASITETQQACAVDFATRCGDYDMKEPNPDSGFDVSMQPAGEGQLIIMPAQSGFFLSISTLFGDDSNQDQPKDRMGGFRRLGAQHHGKGHGPPHHRHHRRHLLHHGMGGDHGHHGHHDEGDGMSEDRPHKCGGPLGFGSREADMCLRESRDSLSVECQQAMAQTEAMFRDLNQMEDEMDMDDYGLHHPHPHKVGALFILFLLSLCLCGSRCANRRKNKVKHVLETLHQHPELKAAVEDAAGTVVPQAGWKCKMIEAIHANPELKAAVEDASKMKMPPSRRNRARRAAAKDANAQGSSCGRCCAMAMIVVSTIMLVSLFSGLCRRREEYPDNEMGIGEFEQQQQQQQLDGDSDVAQHAPDADPIEGFFFSIFFGFLLMFTCSLFFKCVRCFLKRCCGCGDKKGAEYPGAASKGTEHLLRREGDELTVVYIGLPASPEDVPALSKL